MRVYSSFPSSSLSPGLLCIGIIPVPRPRHARQGRLGVVKEEVLEEVEDGELDARHDVRVGLGQDLVPYVAYGVVEYPSDGSVLAAGDGVEENWEERDPADDLRRIIFVGRSTESTR